MPRDGPKAVPKGKGPVSQQETKVAGMRAIMKMLHKMNSHLDKMDSRFDKMDEQGEKTGERKEGAVVNGGHGDTPFIRGGESPSASAREEQLFSNNEEQGHLALFKSGTSSRRQIADSRRGEISSGELQTSDMQSVAERTVFQMVPLAEFNTAVAVVCSSSGEKPGDDESFPTRLEKVMTKIPVSGSGSVMKDRMLRGAMNPTPEVCKLFDPGGEGLPTRCRRHVGALFFIVLQRRGRA